MTCRIFVKRGEFQRYDDLYKAFASNGPTAVAWDRRIRERRKTAQPKDGERRKGDRRGPAPTSWTGLGFVVVDAKGSSPNAR